MKLLALVLTAACCLLACELPATAQAPASAPAPAPAPGTVVVNVPLLVAAPPGGRPSAGIAHVEVRAVRGVGGAVFTQRVPPEAGKMLEAIGKQLDRLYPGKLKAGRIEITYTGAVSAQDLPASGLGLAVALDAVLGGWTPDEGFTALGSFDAEGEPQPVNDAIPRLLAALQLAPKRVLMAERQTAQLTDLMIASGPMVFAGTHFFAVNSYEDVRAIADTKLQPKMAKGLENFGEMQAKLKVPGANPDAVMKDEDVKEALRQTLVSVPGSLSARLLLRITTGQFDKLSSEGTLFAIESMAPTVFAAVQSRRPADLSRLPNSTVQAEVAHLVENKKYFDPRAIPLLEAVIGYGEAVRTFTLQPPSSAMEGAQRTRTLNATAQEVLKTLAGFKGKGRF